MQSRSSLPNADQIGALTATVLLAFALTRILPAAEAVLRFTLGEFFVTYPLSLTTMMTLLATAITAAGMDWLVSGHPALAARRTVEHWLLPTLTVFVVGAWLALLPSGADWWTAFALAGLLLAVIFMAEYVAVDSAAPYYAAATALLTALSFAVYLILMAAIHASTPRLILSLPVVTLASGLVCLRALRLRLGRWEFAWAAGAALISAQLASALHYWPLSPVQFGLALVGPLYAFTSLAGGLGEDVPIRRAAVEPIAALTLAWLAAALLG